jgi:sRNA-binding carbon storage regulator CsrA
MLVLNLTQNESLIINGPCALKLSKKHPKSKRVRVLIDAPPATKITRIKLDPPANNQPAPSTPGENNE